MSFKDAVCHVVLTNITDMKTVHYGRGGGGGGGYRMYKVREAGSSDTFPPPPPPASEKLLPNMGLMAVYIVVYTGM